MFSYSKYFKFQMPAFLFQVDPQDCSQTANRQLNLFYITDTEAYKH